MLGKRCMARKFALGDVPENHKLKKNMTTLGCSHYGFRSEFLDVIGRYQSVARESQPEMKQITLLSVSLNVAS